jgi:hypothetical protein
MTKKEMSIKIASALFDCSVDENNWKVLDLMKCKKSDLKYILTGGVKNV